MNADNFLIDFDGVILNSQERFVDAMGKNDNLYDWMDYLSNLKWYEFLRECEEIDESLSTLRKLQKMKKLKAIITAIHCFEEGKEKLIYLRENGIVVPIIYTLPEQKKSEVYIPKKNIVLVDDKIRNCNDWRKDNGKALEFDPRYEGHSKEKIKSLKQLL